MKPFDIFLWQPAGWPEPHPCVIVSHPDRADRKTPVEVLICTSKRAARVPEPHEIVLDIEDGLDWPTLCKCDLLHAVPRAELKTRKGRVSEARQAQMIRTIIGAHAWADVL